MGDLFRSRRAVISADKRYRYSLTETWGQPPYVTFIMLNPSTADAKTDDSTIRRVRGFTRDWGMGGFFVGNLYAFRTAHVPELLRAKDPIGPDNDSYLRALASNAMVSGGFVVCAWGRHGHPTSQAAKFLELAVELNVPTKALRLLKGGAPEHPLYVPRDITLVEFG